MHHDDPVVPTYYQLIWPTLQAVISLGGSAHKDEIDAAVIESQEFTESQQQVLKGDGPQTLLLDRMSWARSYLKGMGLLGNPRRSIWAVTEIGQAAEERDIKPLHDEYQANARAGSRQRRVWADDGKSPSPPMVAPATEPSDEKGGLQGDTELGTEGWRDLLLDRLLRVHPYAFEHLAQRILREAGFSQVTVTSRSSDGGIDGMGVYQLSLLSFPVYFQCKRYQGSVGSSAIRDFRGAMAGRGDKGLLISTGTFTSDARKEARREGAQPIDLIDGDALCGLLKDLQLGVSTVERVVEDVTVEPEFFDALDDRHGSK
ncbi:restriction endonuclease [Nocardioides humilatus]|uniref:Restriction endonuclease n=2 Tax=Nocardioides humilatus TaxID=2607660 RepID=A0A5B1LJD3_9ACTN|nr:restriction endonuclease [Nocardioides humilatus]